MKITKVLFGACAAILLAHTSLAQQAFLWDRVNGIQSIGSFGGNSLAYGINDSGQVCGESYFADGFTRHAFIWTASAGMVDLGTPGGVISSAADINAAGHIAGYGTTASGEQIAFFWSSTTGFVQIGAPSTLALGQAINDSDEVAGTYLVDGKVHAFFWSMAGGQQDLGLLPGGTFTVGTSISNRHVVVGYGSMNGKDGVPFRWDAVTGLQVLATGRGKVYSPAINEKNAIVGTSYGGSSVVAFYLDPAGALQTLSGDTFNYANDINRRGMIVGSMGSSSLEFQHAALWVRATASPQDLGTLPGATLSIANRINASGQVVGYSY